MKPHLMPEMVIRELEAQLEQLQCGCGAVDGFTYAVRDDSGLTKIGKTSQLRVRVRDLQTFNGSRLHLLGIAHELALEHVLHVRYAEQRMHGEWFALDENPLPIVNGRCVSCRPMSRDESGALELERMRLKERRKALAIERERLDLMRHMV